MSLPRAPRIGLHDHLTFLNAAVMRLEQELRAQAGRLDADSGHFPSPRPSLPAMVQPPRFT